MQGQTDGQASLSHFCSSSQGIDIIPLAFLSQFGAPYTPGGGFGDCNVTQPLPATLSPACNALAQDIKYCQSQNKSIIVSLGGAIGTYGLSNQSDAESVASDLWNQYGPVQSGYKGPRPFGDVVVDGFDLDIENNVGAYNYIFFVERLRSLYASDSSRKYIITAAPQCVVPDASLGDAIFNTEFDYLFLQFYNTPTCSARGKISGYGPSGGPNQYFTFDAWKAFTRVLPYSKSAHAGLLIGLPASVDAAGRDNENRTYYLKPKEAAQLIGDYKSHEGFSGVMLYDAGTSDANVVNNCTYSQQIRRILDTGRTC